MDILGRIYWAVSFSSQDYQSDKCEPFLIPLSVRKENRPELRNKSPRLTVGAGKSTLLLWSSDNVFWSFLNLQFPFWIPHNLFLAQVRSLCLSKLRTCEHFSALSPRRSFFLLLSAKRSASCRGFGRVRICQKSKSFETWWILSPVSILILFHCLISADLIGYWPISLCNEGGF